MLVLMHGYLNDRDALSMHFVAFLLASRFLSFSLSLAMSISLAMSGWPNW